MHTLATYIMVFPRRSVLVMIALLAAGIAEGLSLTALLPLLSVAVGDASSSETGRTVLQAMQRIGIEPTISTMLLIIVIGMITKSLILLLANRQVGYAVAHVASKLRQELIEALIASRWQYYLRQPAGSLANSVATEAYRAAQGFEHAANVMALSIQVIVYSTVALFISWEATLVSLVLGAAMLLVLQNLVRAAGKAGNKQTHLLRHLMSYLADVLTSVKSLKAMARDDVADAILRDETKQLEKATRREVMSRRPYWRCRSPCSPF